MELTRTNVVFNRIAMVLFLCRNKSSRNDLKLHGAIFQKIRKIPAKDEGQGAHRLSTRVGGAPLPRGPLLPLRLQLQLHILCFGEKKNQREEIIAFYDTEPPPSPNLPRGGGADLESVRGSEEGNPSPSSSSTILHHLFHDAHRHA